MIFNRLSVLYKKADNVTVAKQTYIAQRVTTHKE